MICCDMKSYDDLRLDAGAGGQLQAEAAEGGGGLVGAWRVREEEGDESMERADRNLGRNRAVKKPRNDRVPPRVGELLVHRLGELDENQVFVGLVRSGGGTPKGRNARARRARGR